MMLFGILPHSSVKQCVFDEMKRVIVAGELRVEQFSASSKIFGRTGVTASAELIPPEKKLWYFSEISA